VAAGAAVALLTGSGVATAVAVTLAGSIVVTSAPVLSAAWPARGQASQVLAAHLLAWAPFAVQHEPALAGALALGGALVLAEAAVWSQPARDQRAAATPMGLMLTLLALVPIATGALVMAVEGAGIAAVAGAAGAGWLVAAVLDRARSPVGGVPLAMVARLAALVPLAFTPLLPPGAGAAIAGVAAALAIVDALRLDEPRLVTGAGVALPFAVLGLASGAGWTTGEASVVVTLTAAAWLGLAACLPARWAPALAVSAGMAGVTGLLLGLTDGQTAATDLLLIGGMLAAAGLAVGRSEPTVVGLGLATFGLWSHLALAQVGASEPWVAPVAVLLLVAGINAHREHGVSSWSAHAPAVGLLGGTALLERLSGGPAWHALVAGAVGVVAVGAGGARRLAGPLLVGTVLVVAITIHETLGVTAGRPAWMWLALGGVSLLGAGVVMERRGVGPVESGRRLIEVVNDRFA
jgi:hypothetical protein